jgi:hypothetical protein
LLATGTTTVIVTQIAHQRIAAAYPGDWIWEPNSQTLDKVPPLLLIQPARRPVTAVPFEMFGRDRYLAESKTVKELLAAIYAQKDSRLKLNFVVPLTDDKFDCIIVTEPSVKWWDRLQTEINQRFNLIEQPVDTSTVLVTKAQ